MLFFFFHFDFFLSFLSTTFGMFVIIDPGDTQEMLFTFCGCIWIKFTEKKKEAFYWFFDIEIVDTYACT